MKRFMMYGGAVLALATLAVTAVACGDDDDDDDDDGSPTTGVTQTAGGDETVSISDNTFSPADLTISVGDTVTWEWSGSNPHSVVGEFDGEDVESEEMTGTGTFEFTFESEGEFEYECGVHGSEMTGTITVES